MTKEITVNRKALASALSALNRATMGNSVMPILQNVLLDSDGETLRLSATNLEVFGSLSLPASGAKFDTTVNLKQLADYAANFSGDAVALKLDDTRLRIVAGSRQKASLATIDPEQFPVPFSVEGDIFTLSMESFVRAAERVAVFASTKQDRPILTGTHVVSDGSKIMFEAADNYRVGRVTIKSEAPVFDVVIPARSLVALGRLIEAATVSVQMGKGVVEFSTDEATFAARLTEGHFPNVDTVLPKEFAANFTIEREGLVKAVKLAGMASDVVIRFGSSDEGLRVSAENVDGDFEAIVPATFSSDTEILFALGRDLAASTLSAVDGNTLEVGFNDKLTPIGLTDPDDDSFASVIMPVRTPA